MKKNGYKNGEDMFGERLLKETENKTSIREAATTND